MTIKDKQWKLDWVIQFNFSCTLKQSGARKTNILICTRPSFSIFSYKISKPHVFYHNAFHTKISLCFAQVKVMSEALHSLLHISYNLVTTLLIMAMVGAVSNISAYDRKVPSSIPGSAEIWIFVRPYFPPKLTQLSFLPG
mgnify:CR=1 FL=1